MKKIIVCLFSLLLSGIISLLYAQDYKYFNLTFKSNSIVGFSPKHLKPGSMERTNGASMIREAPKLDASYFNTFMPIFKDIFGADFKYENWRILRRINCAFWFREDFKPFYYQITFPTELLDEFPQWEEKLYQLCERSMKVDIHPFIRSQRDKPNFEWSTFQVNLANLYMYSEGRFRMEDY